jgi:hypothetical protein
MRLVHASLGGKITAASCHPYLFPPPNPDNNIRFLTFRLGHGFWGKIRSDRGVFSARLLSRARSPFMSNKKAVFDDTPPVTL